METHPSIDVFYPDYVGVNQQNESGQRCRVHSRRKRRDSLLV